MDAVTTAADLRERVFCILNPVSRSFHQAREAVVRACRSSGRPEPVILTTTKAEPGGVQAREALASGATVIVVGGGDGTVREVAHEVTGSGADLGVLPIGTANLFAHNLGLRTRNLRRAVATALAAEPRKLDVGRAVWRPVIHGRVQPPVAPHTFLVMAGLGHDAATVLAVRPEFKRRIGWLAYLAAGASQLRSHPISMRLSVDGGPARQLRTWSLLAANLGRLPSGLAVFPDALADDGVLDTLEVPLTSPWQWGPVALKGVGLRRDVPALRYGRAHRLWAVPEHPALLHLDGDVVGRVADLHITVLPRALRVRAPQPPRSHP